ncbi:MAG: hypothetical protein ABEJ90_04415 [Halobacterium sp.]
MTRVGLLGDGADDAAESVRDAGGTPVFGGDAGDADVVAAFGEDAFLDAAGDVDTPVLPVGAGAAYGGVDSVDSEDALSALATGDFEVRSRRTLSVTAGETVRAFADATLVASDPGDISEFAVRSDGREVDTVRADGVVAATPTGSHGYAADAGGPLLDPGIGAVSVVPVAPFRVERTNWVLGPPATLTVVRREAAVDLYVDGRRRGAVEPHEPVVLDWGAPLAVAAVPVSRRSPPTD